MTYKITTYRGSSTGQVHEAHAELPEVTRDEVYVAVTHSGVCGTDEHFKYVDMVLGHEGVGVVEAIGPEVKALKVGDRVGWGYTHSTCGICEQCVAGFITHCTSPTKAEYGRANLHQGSFGTGAVWREGLLFQLPADLPSDAAAPLMCAGVTVWAPLINVKPFDVVGIVGVGGLGHLAIQFAAKMGCEVVALSQSEDKKSDALKLGATHFVATKGVKELQVPRKINHLLVTTSKMPDWNQFSSILAPMATIYPLTIMDFEAKLEIPFMQFLLGGWRFVGSTVPQTIEYVRMLRFAALHGVSPVIEGFPLNEKGVRDSLKVLDEGRMRFRGVLYADRREN